MPKEKRFKRGVIEEAVLKCLESKKMTKFQLVKYTGYSDNEIKLALVRLRKKSNQRIKIINWNNENGSPSAIYTLGKGKDAINNPKLNRKRELNEEELQEYIKFKALSDLFDLCHKNGVLKCE